MNLRAPFSFFACAVSVISMPGADHAASAAPVTGQPLTVAVFDFSVTLGSAARDMGEQVAGIVGARLSADPRFVTVERSDLKKILSEHELSLSGNVSQDSAARIGQLTGAKVLVTGRVFSADNNLLLVAKVMGTETGRVYGEVVNGAGGISVVDLASSLEQKIADDLATKSDAFVAATAVSAEERIARLKASLQGKKLPVVAVHIAERTLTPRQRLIDPAAQTEFGMILQQCGFTVVDDASAQRPDVEISGEAFSSFGMRHGNLISCEARVELKARETAQGAIKVIDRQTSVAVGLDDPTAEKSALDAAALALAERVLPKIAE